MLSLTVK